MIGPRGAASAAAAMLIAVALGPYAADPSVLLAAERVVHARALAATTALDALLETLQPALEDARRAASAVHEGEDRPGPMLEAAGDRIAAAEDEATTARRVVARLNGALASWREGDLDVHDPPDAGVLPSIGAQLAAAAEDADAFAARRDPANDLPAAIDRALEALEAGNPDAAAGHLADARAARELAAAWEEAPASLPVWLDTTGAMIRAVDTIIEAVRAGDIVAADEAAGAFAALQADAASADRALRIALSEGGADLTAAPMTRLADALRRASDARADAAAIADATAP